jgi:hypothetical protein
VNLRLSPNLGVFELCLDRTSSDVGESLPRLPSRGPNVPASLSRRHGWPFNTSRPTPRPTASSAAKRFPLALRLPPIGLSSPPPISLVSPAGSGDAGKGNSLGSSARLPCPLLDRPFFPVDDNPLGREGGGTRLDWAERELSPSASDGWSRI